ncbi:MULTISPECIES: TrbI/VirB10 family protein [Aerosakkonema]|uniref:TrbI/VirB10 family protein n=1 Tax=Aerosakkonema TaxID=1246629 RepID=UPI0035BB4533
MANTDNYSQFADFDPDNIRASESSSPSSEVSLGLPERSSSSPESLERPSSSDRNEDETGPVWNLKKLTELVNFEEDTEPRPAKKSDSPGEEKGTPNNIISRDELFESDLDDPNQSKTERSFSNSPWTKGGLVGMGAMVVFVSAGLFLNNVFNRGKVAQAPPTPTPTPAVTPAPTPTENETGKLKTEIALGTQAEQLAALNRAKSPSNPTPTPTPTAIPSPSVAPTASNTSPNQAQTSTPAPTPTAKPVVRPPASSTASRTPRVIVREVVKRVPVPVPVPQPAPVRQVPTATNRPAPVPVALDRPGRQIVRSTPPLRSERSPAPTIAPTPKPPAVQPKEPPIAPTPKPTRATEASPPPDPFAQWQALASVGSYGQADVPGDDGQEVAAVPVPSQQAEPTMPGQIGVSPVPVSAYPYTVMPPAAPGAYSPGEQVPIAAAQRSSIELPKAVRVITAPAPYTNQAPSNDAAEESLLLNGSRSPAIQPQPEVAAIDPEESLLVNGSRSPAVQSQPTNVAQEAGTQAVDAEEDVLLGRAPQQVPNSVPLNFPSSLSGQYLQVGTTASGFLITPVLKESGTTTAYSKDINEPSNPNAQRFAVRLESALSNPEGQPILNQGTLIVFTVASVGSNGWVNATAESVVFPDGSEYRLPPGAIEIRGNGGEPLIAKKWDDKSREFFSQNANAFLFGALSNVGRVLNQPRSESYEYNSGLGFGLGRRSIERNSPNVLGTVLSGGFTPVLESIMQRNAMAIQEMRQRSNIWYVSAGKEVQIFVNQSFQF